MQTDREKLDKRHRKQRRRIANTLRLLAKQLTNHLDEIGSLAHASMSLHAVRDAHLDGVVAANADLSRRLAEKEQLERVTRDAAALALAAKETGIVRAAAKRAAAGDADRTREGLRALDTELRKPANKRKRAT